MVIGIAVVMMVVMMGGMLFMGHGKHKHSKNDEQETSQESVVKKSTEPVSGVNAPHTEHHP
ncbi:MAG: hypothetical protein A3G41_04435 [Elusimicrobia bacterium RIFCSPLOWO2_12_FULL_59_9]|nr:MAG: hypothetical protein A3G41_04435 [Elusimicrobia bacterium RIFCSPLOWO2_12_FULL_59_9]